MCCLPRSLVGVRFGVPAVVLLHPAKLLSPPQKPNRCRLKAELIKATVGNWHVGGGNVRELHPAKDAGEGYRGKYNKEAGGTSHSPPGVVGAGDVAHRNNACPHQPGGSTDGIAERLLLPSRNNERKCSASNIQLGLPNRSLGVRFCASVCGRKPGIFPGSGGMPE